MNLETNFYGAVNASGENESESNSGVEANNSDESDSENEANTTNGCNSAGIANTSPEVIDTGGVDEHGDGSYNVARHIRGYVRS